MQPPELPVLLGCQLQVGEDSLMPEGVVIHEAVSNIGMRRLDRDVVDIVRPALDRDDLIRTVLALEPPPIGNVSLAGMDFDPPARPRRSRVIAQAGGYTQHTGRQAFQLCRVLRVATSQANTGLRGVPLADKVAEKPCECGVEVGSMETQPAARRDH